MSFRDWDIFDEMARLRRELGQLATSLQPGGEQWTPRVDILERETEFVLLVDLPGVKREDIEVRVEANTLTLEGGRARPEGVRELRLERPMGRFRRSFRLGLPISPHTVRAMWREGVLEVVLPKASRQEPAQVRVTLE